MNIMIPNFEIWQKGYQMLMAIYRLVDVFPKERRFSIGSDLKHSANEVLTKIAVSKLDLAHEKILETISNLEVAKGLNLAKPLNFQILTQKYQDLAEEISRESGGLTSSEKLKGLSKTAQTKTPRKKLNPRQKKIIEKVKKNNKINFSQIRQIFPKVSTRTLRLDLKNLLARKLIRKNGKSVKTHYTLLK